MTLSFEFGARKLCDSKFCCYKTLARHNIWFDVISGSSIGSVNSTIIAASLRNLGGENPDRDEFLIESAKKLEDFWLHAADNLTPAFLPFGKIPGIRSKYFHIWPS
jgi:predicted acylesterase/phospholipase RssA